MINTIIVPTDGSDHANKAIEMTGEIAVKFGARVVVVQALLQHATAPDLKASCQEIGIAGDVVKEIDELTSMVERVAASGYPQGPHSRVARDSAQGR
ncbi:MAG: universal stress protein [Deltaproteobacteria bacterium]|nr:universal stress protein [Deltaproteobacteria bacterium]